MEHFSERMIRHEERRRRGIHKWDYEYPTCLWEELTWWVRWPMAMGLILFFGGAIIAPIISLLR